MSDFRELLVWRKAHTLSLEAHRVASKIRGTQSASLRSQLTRAAESIPANIVESRGQISDRDEIRFLMYSINSSNELEYHVLFGTDLGVISGQDSNSLTAQVIEVRRMIYGLVNYLRRKNGTTGPR